jgi:phosphate transport system protein
MSDHTSKQFDAEMETIRGGVLSMGGLVERQVRRAIEALGADEREINQMQVMIDQQCTQIIARRQPTAVDLRLIMTVTKIVNDLERIGDEAKKIAYKAANVRGSDRLTRIRYHDVVRMAAGTQMMLREALDAFARLDVAAAARVVEEDDDIDVAFNAVMRQLISFMMEDPRTISAALEVVFIAKSIERIGDHSKNVAESVVQAVKGKDVRHASADQIRAELAGE